MQAYPVGYFFAADATIRSLFVGDAIVVALVHFQRMSKMAPSPKLLSDDRLGTDGIRASGHQHSVQHRHADRSFGLLDRKAAGAQARSDQRLVPTHCRFY
jgi:hypothetical protein